MYPLEIKVPVSKTYTKTFLLILSKVTKLRGKKGGKEERKMERRVCMSIKKNDCIYRVFMLWNISF